MKIEVRPIPVKRWHRKEGKESFTRPTRLSPLVDAEKMEYATGLSPEEIIEYSGRMNVDLNPQYNPDKAHPFWDTNSASVKLENQTMFFDTENMNELLKIKLMKASKYVANSLREYQEGMFPEATHVIYDEREEVEVKAGKVAIKRKAIIESAKLSKVRKAQIVLLLAGKNVKEKSEDFIEVELDKLIQTKTNDVLRYIQRDVELTSTEALITEAIQKSVLKVKGHKVMYHDSVLGTDVSDVATYFNQPENQDLKIRIIEAVK